MKNIVITGRSTGIGLETAFYLKSQGLNIFPTVREEEDVKRLKKLGFDNTRQLDVTNYEQIDEVIEYVLEKVGTIDVWFNNAGYGQAGYLEDISAEVLREQFETNIFALHEATRKILPIMRRQGQGKIIQHRSVLGLVSLVGRGAYNASKYAIEGLTDTLRLELQGSNIYVSLLNTGPITSDFRKNAMKKLQENVDIDSSIYRDGYLKSLNEKKSKVPFNEEALSVAKVVHKIVLSPRPKPRYYITKATYLLGYLKRVLSTSMLDKILIKIG